MLRADAVGGGKKKEKKSQVEAMTSRWGWGQEEQDQSLEGTVRTCVAPIREICQWAVFGA